MTFNQECRWNYGSKSLHSFSGHSLYRHFSNILLSIYTWHIFMGWWSTRIICACTIAQNSWWQVTYNTKYCPKQYTMKHYIPFHIWVAFCTPSGTKNQRHSWINNLHSTEIALFENILSLDSWHTSQIYSLVKSHIFKPIRPIFSFTKDQRE